MATIEVRIDDLDGSEITDKTIKPLEVKVDGTTYKLDLSAANTAKFMDFLEGKGGLVSNTRTASVRKAAASSSGSGKTKEELDKVRTWANANGHQVAAQGRISKKVLDAYDAAH